MDNHVPENTVETHYLGDKGKEYFSRQIKQGNLQGLFNRHLWQKYISKDDSVLDFGCSGGFLLHAIESGRKVGVDINPWAREYAMQKGIDVYSDIKEVPGLFDRVISSHAIEHVQNPMESILQMKIKLRDDNSLLLMLLPLDDWRVNSQRYYREENMDMHLFAWTPQSIGNLVKSAGMKVKMVKIISHAWPPHSEIFWKISPTLFHRIARMWAVLRRRRQIFIAASIY